MVVTLASSEATSHSPTMKLKANMCLNRQQLFRSSKKFKRQLQQEEQIQETTITTPFFQTTNEQAEQVNLKLLSCYEDSSFIYTCKAPSSSSNSPQRNQSSTRSANSSLSSISPGASSLDSSSMQSIPFSAGAKLEPNGSSSNSSGHYSLSASPSCISAFDYCHLSSPSSRGSSSSPKKEECSVTRRSAQSVINQTTFNTLDPVYLEDDEVFYNLIIKERFELKQRQLAASTSIKHDDNKHTKEDINQLTPLVGHSRHSLLSWMLKVCEHTSCQDEIFPLATMILDKFLLFNPTVLVESSSWKQDDNDDQQDKEFLCCVEEEELSRRQLYLFAACSLLLATKLRQTPRLCIQILIEFSRAELSVELNREEVLDCELLILASLKWDLAALVTPNDFFAVLVNKCAHLLPASLDEADVERRREENCQKEEVRVRRHTQTLLELCLMDTKLSQFAPSILAMTSMAVAINGLTKTKKTCWRLKEIVIQIHEATHEVNELKQMIDVAFQIEKYLQKLLNYTNDD